jgi:hypothetical protein
MKTETGRIAPLRAAYDTAFEILCYARRELDLRSAAGADREALRCFEGIVASAQREYARARNAFAMLLLERQGADVPEPWREPQATAMVACQPRMCCAV